MDKEKKSKNIRMLSRRVDMLNDMLQEKISKYCENNGGAGFEYPRNHNASKKAIKEQIKTLRNELLVLSEAFEDFDQWAV